MTLKNYIFICLFITLTSSFAQQNSLHYIHLVSTPDTLIAGTPQQIKLNIIVDSIPLQKNTNIKLIFPKEFSQFAFDNNPLPFPLFPSLQHGYCLVKGNKPYLHATIVIIKPTRDEFTGSYPFDGYRHDDNEPLMTIRLDTIFNVHDTLSIIYGYGNVNNYINIPNFSFYSQFKLLVDPLRNGAFVFQNAAPIRCIAKKADDLQLILSSTAKKDQAVLLKAVIEDNNFSIYPSFTGSFKITCSDASATFNSVITFTKADSGHLEIPVTFHQNGIFTCSAELISSNAPLSNIYNSNPINVSSDSMQIFWGEFHTHTEYSRDGTGDHAFDYAKYGACLDFFAQTDHADGNDEAGIDAAEWSDIIRNVKRYDQPGRFVTFAGYEESMSAPSGHYNVIFNAPDSLLNLVPNMSNQVYNTIQKIWDRLDIMDPRITAITIPHHTGKIFSIYPFPACSSCNEFGGAYANSKYKRILEIYSGHGLSESYNPSHPLSYESLNATAKSGNGPNYAQDALAMREKLGIIASSDNHLSRATQKHYGAFAVLADSLERNTIFTYINKRHTYGTTGERMVVKFYVNNYLMGEELNLPCDQYPKLKIEVNGTDTLESVEILKWDFKNGTYTTDAHPIFSSIKKYSITGGAVNFKDSLIDGSLTDSSVYYVRVKQKNNADGREAWAWTSPVWVNKARCNSSARDTIVYFDASDSSAGNHHTIQLQWIVDNQVNAHYYILQRSNDSIHFTNLASIDHKGNTGERVSYAYTDSLPYDSVLYYRVQLFTYFNSVATSRMDSVHIKYLVDSLVAFHALLGTDGVQVSWIGKEFLVMEYNVTKAPLHGGPLSLHSQKPVFSNEYSSYSFLDSFPLKDSSLYRVLMRFPNGTFLFSKTDTVYFIMDSIIDFYTQLNGDSVLISWKGVNENHTEFYEVQKGKDRTAWNTIEKVFPVRSLFETAYYVRYDTIPVPGMNYYRIQQTVSGETSHFSRIDSQRIISTGMMNHHVDDQTSIRIFNSFFREGSVDLTVQTNSDKQVKGEFMIVDISGGVMYKEQADLPKGQYNYIFPTAGLSSNIYFLLFRTDDRVIKNTFYILDEH